MKKVIIVSIQPVSDLSWLLLIVDFNNIQLHNVAGGINAPRAKKPTFVKLPFLHNTSFIGMPLFLP